MLVLEIVTKSYYGVNHPEGFNKKYSYFNLNAGMTLDELEKIIIEKTNCNDYNEKTFKVFRVEDCCCSINGGE